MTGFINARGDVQQLDLQVGMYREAAARGMSLQQYINITYPTNAEKYGTTFAQLMEAEGIFLKADRSLGIRPSTMMEIIHGKDAMSAGIVTKEAAPASRILFPAVIMGAIEDKLLSNLDMTASAFEKMIAVDESINGDKYEYPVLNFTKAEQGRSQGIAQLAQPASMMLITASDKSFKIPRFSLGLEISDDALKITTIDFLALSLARQAAVERNERVHGYILALLNGDLDNGDSQSLSSLGYVQNSTFFDATVGAGTLSQKAWMKYLMYKGTQRTITHIITDVDTALKIEGRTGKPEVMKDDSKTHRFDTQFQVMNPTWAKNPELFLIDTTAGTPGAAWPANTLLGLDKNWAIRRVRNLFADYQAIEAYVLRRSTAMRFDYAEHVNRLYPEAFGGMVVL